MHHKGMLATQSGQDLGQWLNPRGTKNTQNLMSSPCGIGQRTQEIEQGTNANLASWSRRMLHGRVMALRKKKTQSDRFNRIPHRICIKVQSNPRSLQKIRAS
jgi:hypothetical protein